MLTLVGMTLPAIAIVTHVAAIKVRETAYASKAFIFTLIALSLILLAAASDITFLVYASNQVFFNAAVALYLASLAAILISSVFLYLAYKK